MPESRLLTDIGTLLFFGAGIYWMGRHEHKRVSKDSRRKYVHGRYIPEWVAIGFMGPGLVAYILNWPNPTTGMGPMILSWFGLLVGLAGGWIHGGFRLLFDRPDSSTPITNKVDPRPEDGNPYRPPDSG
ncbi:hypothetical protein [Stieleria varia]|uniref:Uncharacterized protein n=1 Tax=Stieleria varia TaxID=2528005 RepID=A0A5C6AE03_9BACT|nr:hypothetical protein [Stieleria varia]TWT98282.1 hypothetical protein Pla52n_47920 [Stieleria varia]